MSATSEILEEVTCRIVGRHGTPKRKRFERGLKAERKPYRWWAGKKIMSDGEYQSFPGRFHPEPERDYFYRLAKKAILSGKSREQTFDELRPATEMQNNRLAMIIGQIPTPGERKKYRFPQVVFICLLVLKTLSYAMSENGMPFTVLYAMLLTDILIYSPGYHKATAILGIAGLLFDVFMIISLPFDARILINIMFSLAVIYLGFFLDKVLFPKFRIAAQEYADAGGNIAVHSVVQSIK